MKAESRIEKFFGNPLTGGLATSLGTAASTQPGFEIVGGLLPVLANTLAFERFKARVADAIVEIEQHLSAHEDALHKMSDAQFKIVNDAIAEAMRALDGEKLSYLKRVVANAIFEDAIESHEASLVSRIIRDISAREIKFIIENFQHKTIFLGDYPQSENPESETSSGSTRSFHINSSEAIVINGLANLTILVPSTAYLGVEGYQFSAVTARIIALVAESPRNHGNRL